LWLGFYFGMLSEHFEVCWFGVESDFCVGQSQKGLLLEPPHLHKAVKTLPSK
jgi:hypothetical protein